MLDTLEALLGLLGSQDTVSQDTLNLSNVSNISTTSSLSKLSTVMQSHARDTGPALGENESPKRKQMIRKKLQVKKTKTNRLQ